MSSGWSAYIAQDYCCLFTVIVESLYLLPIWQIFIYFLILIRDVSVDWQTQIVVGQLHLLHIFIIKTKMYISLVQGVGCKMVIMQARRIVNRIVYAQKGCFMLFHERLTGSLFLYNCNCKYTVIYYCY